jgi:hypothetical protein
LILRFWDLEGELDFVDRIHFLYLFHDFWLWQESEIMMNSYVIEEVFIDEY